MLFRILTTLLITFFSFNTSSQYEGIDSLPLPSKFDGMREVTAIASSPNPNLPEFENENQEGIVWKHQTKITAPEDIKIIETGAYLLNNGTWWLRASFKPKATKKMFATKTLALAKGQTITFENNNRYGKYTQTGFNFWYCIAKTADGELIFSYEILETSGKMADGTEVLVIINKNTQLNWTGMAGDSDYKVEGTVKSESGELITKNGIPIGGQIAIDLNSLSCEYESLSEHLKSSDFFNIKKHPIALYKVKTIEKESNTEMKLNGSLIFLGISMDYSLNASVMESDSAYDLTISTTKINRVDYGMFYASTKDESQSDYSIADYFELAGSVSFQKNYPGAAPWNTIQK